MRGRFERVLIDAPRWLLLALLFWAPLAYGSTRDWTLVVMNWALSAIAVLWLAGLILRKRLPLVPLEQFKKSRSRQFGASRVGWASRPPSDASCVAAFGATAEDRFGETPKPAGETPTLTRDQNDVPATL